MLNGVSEEEAAANVVEYKEHLRGLQPTRRKRLNAWISSFAV